MPFYEYECSNCKFYVEVLQKITDEPLKQCPSCKKKALKKLVSAPVFRLKGGGWYETDFKSEKEEKRNLAEREEAEAKETKAEEAKPEAKDKEAAKPAEKAETKKVAVRKPAAASKATPKKAVKPVSRPKAKAKAKPAKKKARR